MKSIVKILLSFLLVCSGYGQDKQDDRLISFSAQPNDWFSEFEFRALRDANPKKVETVFVVLTDNIKDLESKIIQPIWRSFSDKDEIGIVGIVYKYQNAKPKGSNPNFKPLWQNKPEEAMNLLKNQLDLLVHEQFPGAREYGYVAGGKAFTIVQHLLRTEPKETIFWIVEDELWFIPKDLKKIPEGLVVSRNVKNLSKMLEAQITNAEIESNVVFVHNSTEDRSAVDEFIKEFINVSVSKHRKRPMICDLISEQEIKINDSRTASKSRTRLPDSVLLEPWRKANDLGKKDRLPDVIVESVETGVHGQSNLTLYLKMPKTTSTDEPPRGVLCIATWMGSERSLKDIILHGRIRPDLLKWAEERKMAVVTWNTATLWKSGVSQEDLDKKVGRHLDNNFDEVASAWDQGMKRLSSKYKLPETGYYLYGLSRGSHWGHRLALRVPERFGSVHIHVANSYDIPNNRASNILWLVTTGELDYGYQPAMKFYRECRSLGYPIIIKAGENLGHGESPQIVQLGLKFFEYCASLKDEICPDRQPTGGESKKIADMMRRDLSKARYFGDFINQEVYTAKSGDWIPLEQRIPIATLPIAEAWGKSINK